MIGRFDSQFREFTDEEISEWKRQYGQMLKLQKKRSDIVWGDIHADIDDLNAEITKLHTILTKTCVHTNTIIARSLSFDGTLSVKKYCTFCEAEEITKTNGNKELLRLLLGMRQVILDLPVELPDDSTNFLNDPIWDSFDNNRGKK